ncbi:hypothetical protein [Methanococcoides sp. LMO-2]|uniref:Uncharacterized protein n=1 Tax=Methanococcoides cohabitans TaxID=3136559 RepID=A0ABU9KU85_9EURY
MTTISENDRFECRVVNIIDNLKQWKGVTVEDIDSGGRVYFAKVKAEGFNVAIGDSLYIGIKELPYGIEEMSMEVHLYDEDDKELDWTIL